MPAKWTGDIVRRMHLNRITRAELAAQLGVSKAYITMVLNGEREPAGAEQRFKAALDELIQERKK